MEQNQDKNPPENIPEEENPATGEDKADTSEQGPGDNVEEQETDPGGDANGGKSGRVDLSATVFTVVFWVVILGAFGYNYFGIGDPELEIVFTARPVPAGVEKEPNEWVVSGHLIYAGEFVSEIGVWAIASDNQGNRYSTGKALSTDAGKFELEPIPNVISGQVGRNVVEIAVFAAGEFQDDDDDTIQLGPVSERMGIGSGQRFRVINLPVKELLIIASIFALSVTIALIPVPQGTRTTAWLVAKYLSSVVLAFLLTVFMILYISLALRYVNQTAANVQNEVLSLGVASIFKGRYVDDVQEEWLISLTSPSFASTGTPARQPEQPPANRDAGDQGDSQAGPNPPATEPAGQSGNLVSGSVENVIEEGFGAPLWTLLVSVIGAALFTITIILDGIKEAPLTLAPNEIRKRIQGVVLHQFYILFAPVGAIFIYQMLVLAGAVSQTVTVAIIILAAGIALNLLLEKARESIEGLVLGTTKGKEDKEDKE